mgnify:CR=1 FL=1
MIAADAVGVVELVGPIGARLPAESSRHLDHVAEPALERLGDRLPQLGLQAAAARPGVHLFHAGTTLDAAGRVRTMGGRVLAVTALGDDVAAAQRLIPCSLELGGKDAMIVCADANLPNAISGCLWGGFANAGQTCSGIERVYVVDEVAERDLVYGACFHDWVAIASDERRVG